MIYLPGPGGGWLGRVLVTDAGKIIRYGIKRIGKALGRLLLTRPSSSVSL